jgi:hypothetical protein
MRSVDRDIGRLCRACRDNPLGRSIENDGTRLVTLRLDSCLGLSLGDVIGARIFLIDCVVGGSGRCRGDRKF